MEELVKLKRKRKRIAPKAVNRGVEYTPKGVIKNFDDLSSDYGRVIVDTCSFEVSKPDNFEDARENALFYRKKCGAYKFWKEKVHTREIYVTPGVVDEMTGDFEYFLGKNDNANLVNRSIAKSSDCKEGLLKAIASRGAIIDSKIRNSFAYDVFRDKFNPIFEEVDGVLSYREKSSLSDVDKDVVISSATLASKEGGCAVISQDKGILMAANRVSETFPNLNLGIYSVAGKDKFLERDFSSC